MHAHNVKSLTQSPTKKTKQNIAEMKSTPQPNVSILAMRWIHVGFKGKIF